MELWHLAINTTKVPQLHTTQSEPLDYLNPIISGFSFNAVSLGIVYLPDKTTLRLDKAITVNRMKNFNAIFLLMAYSNKSYD